MKGKLNRISIVTIGLMTLIGATVWAWYAPYAFDDQYYRMTFTDNYDDESWVGIEPELETFGQAWQSVVNHVQFNGRLTNFVHILFQPLGHDVEAVFLGLCIALAFAGFCMTGSREGRPSALTVVTAAVSVWLIYPWYDGFQGFSFVIGYWPPSVLLMALVLLLRRKEGYSVRRRVALYVTAFFAAWSNEGNAAVLLVYLAVSAAMDGRRSVRPLWQTAAWVAVGLAVNLLTGTVNRIMYTSGEVHIYSRQFFVVFVTELWPLALALVFLGVTYLLTARGERRGLLLRFVPDLVAMVCGVAVGLVLCRGERVLWTAYLFANFIILECVEMWSRRTPARVQGAVLAVFTLVYAFWLVELCRWEKLVGDENRFVEASCGHQRPGGVSVTYGRHVSEDSIPYWLMGVVSNPLENSWGIECMAMYIDTLYATPMVMPEELRGKAFEEWPAVPGDNDIRGVWPMIASRDSTSRRLRMYVGRASDNMSPADRLFLLVRGREFGEVGSVEFNAGRKRAVMPDGSIIYRCVPERLPRTIRHREVLAVDTVSGLL